MIPRLHEGGVTPPLGWRDAPTRTGTAAPPAALPPNLGDEALPDTASWLDAAGPLRLDLIPAAAATRALIDRLTAARLVAEHRVNLPGPVLLRTIAADCPRMQAVEIHEVCVVHLPQLSWMRVPHARAAPPGDGPLVTHLPRFCGHR
jgi:hypothetical protein